MGAFDAEADLAQAHRQAGVMNGNLQALFQRTMSELARSTNRFEACLLAVTISQRLLVSLNTLQIIGVRPELASADGKQFAVSLKDLGDALETNARPPPSEELGDALHALRGVMARNAAGSSLRPTLIARIGQQVLLLQAAAARLSMADEPA